MQIRDSLLFGLFLFFSFTSLFAQNCEEDREPPMIIGCVNGSLGLRVASTDPGSCQATVSFPSNIRNLRAIDNCDENVLIRQSPPGNVFPIGITNVFFRAIDDRDNVSECIFTVRVNDNEPPKFNCPNREIVRTVDTGRCYATIRSFEIEPSASDNCEVTNVTAQGIPTGNRFEVGEHKVIYRAFDAAENVAVCTLTVIVRDNISPTIECPADIQVQAMPGSNGAFVEFPAATVSDNCPNVMTTHSYQSGSFFEVGTTTVTVTAKDVGGNEVMCTFDVVVEDVETCENRALDFDGVDNYIDIPNPPLSGNPDFTVEMWFISTSTNIDCDGGFRRLFGWLGSSNNSRFEIGECTGFLTIFYNPGNILHELSNTANLRDGNWHHVAVSKSNTTVTIFLDGVQAFQANDLPANLDLSTPMRVGRWGGGAAADQNWLGQIDEVRIWSGARTPSQIQSLLNCQLTGLEQNLLIYYNFNQGIPGGGNSNETVAFDLAGMPQNGNLSGFALNGNTSNWICSGTGIERMCPEPCVANFQWAADDCGVVSFFNQSSGNNLQYLWSFGDQTNASTDQNPTHTYATSGIFTVCLTITSGECEDQICQEITVTVDNEPPVITCTPGVIANTAPGSCEATVQVPLPDASDNCAGLLTTAMPTGNIFPVGTTEVVFTAIDAAGNVARCTTTVTVRDREAPVIECPENISVQVMPGEVGATVVFDDPVANDNCPGVTTVCSQESGDFFPIGTTTVNCVATDAAGNQAECAFSVTLEDPCENLDVTIDSIETQSGCCYELDFDLNISLFSIEAELITPDITFSNIQVGTDLVATQEGQTVTLRPEIFQGIPAGTYNDALSFCFENVTVSPQQVVIRYYQQNELDIPRLICTDTLQFNCSTMRPCLDFEDTETPENWFTTAISNISIDNVFELPINKPANPTGNVLQITDGSGGSTAINNVDFTGNWLELAENGCLCFDYTVLYNASNGAVATAPKIEIYTGNPVTTTAGKNNALRAAFVGHPNNPVVNNGEWDQYCLPIGLCINGKIPSNAFGSWRIIDGSNGLITDPVAACDAWNTIIQNVTGFVILADYNGDPSEQIYFDNFCWQCPPPGSCSCEEFSRIAISEGDNLLTNVQCGNEPIELRCPNPELGYTFTGMAGCQGEGNCGINPDIEWELVHAASGMTYTGTSSSPDFAINISADKFSAGGLYLLTLTKFCGVEKCECTIQFIVPQGCTFSCPIECAVDVINISTGIDPVTNTTIPVGQYDPYWVLYGTPDPGITVPRGASVIPGIFAWQDQMGTQWISAYPTAGNNASNLHPVPSYDFKNCFCICEPSAEVTIDLSVLVDNNLDIDLIDNAGNKVLDLLDITNNTVAAFTTPTTATITTTLLEGSYCLSAQLRNVHPSSAMGLNIQGSITGAGLLSSRCCSSFNSMTGVKYQDSNCNGSRSDNINAEPGLQDWTIMLCDPTDGSILYSTQTDPFGYYVFNDIPPGTYLVKEQDQNGWNQSEPVSGTYEVTIGNNQIIGNLDFGNCYDPGGELCCQNQMEFDEKLAQGFTVDLDDENCKVTVTAPQFDTCHWFISTPYVAGGDAPIQVITSPFGSWMFDFDQPGNYDICVTVVEGDSPDNICWRDQMCTTVTVPCPTGCYCAPPSSITISANGATVATVNCGDEPIRLPCLDENTSYNFTGFMDCEGDGNCGINPDISWELTHISTGIVDIGTTSAPNLNLSLAAGLFSQPGLYELSMIKFCAGRACECKIQFEVPICDGCDCPNGAISGPNLIVNGDFSVGNTGFTNDYNYITPGNTINVGDYSVLNSTQVSAANTQWAGVDHTTGSVTGNFLVCDGVAGDDAWRQTVTVAPGNEYVFCFYANNLVLPNREFTDPTLQAFINGMPVTAAVTIPENPDDWVRISGSWVANNSTADIEIRVISSGGEGNDFAIDDISFHSCSIRNLCCQDEQSFLDKVAQGFTIFEENCTVHIIPNELDECHQVTYTWGDGSAPETYIPGNAPISHTYDAAQEYEICVTVQELDASGEICFAKDTCFRACITCIECTEPVSELKWSEADGNSPNFSGSNSNFYITTDKHGDFYTTGSFEGSYLGVNNSNGRDGFLAKYKNDGSDDWHLPLSGAGEDLGTVVKVKDGLVYVAGIFNSPDLELASKIPGIPIQLQSNGLEDCFVAQYTKDGVLNWAFSFGGDLDEQLEDLTIDDEGNIIVTGRFGSEVDFNPRGSSFIVDKDIQQVFVAKYNSNGNLDWVNTFGGTETVASAGSRNDGLGVSTDGDKNVYLVGQFEGEVDIDGDGNADFSTNVGRTPFIAKFDKDGNHDWSFPIQDANENSGGAVWDVVADANYLYVGGLFDGSGVNFAPSGGNAATLNAANGEGFLAKYTLNGENEWAYNVDAGVRELTIDQLSNIYTIGWFQGNFIDMDVKGSQELLPNNGQIDMFVGKYDSDANLICAFNPGGSAFDLGWSVAPDLIGDFAIIGRFGSSNFDADSPSNNGPEHDAGGNTAIYIGKYTCDCPPEPCEGCCTDFEAFNDKVTQGFTIELDEETCKVTVTAPQFDTCHWFTTPPDWGDGAPVADVIVPANGMWMHTYEQNGTYNICVTVEERRGDREPCWMKEMCTTVEVTGCTVDTCCTDREAFVERVANLSFMQNYVNCSVTVSAEGLGECDQITWDWGDGATTGPLTGNAMTTHNYTTPGAYEVCYTVQEVDEDGNICWEEERCLEQLVKCTDQCTCDRFTSITIGPEDRRGLSLECNSNSATLLPCWQDATPPISISGRLMCTPSTDGCVSSSIEWSMKNPLGVLTSGIANVDVTSGGFKFIVPIDFCLPGLYEVEITGTCGSNTCSCKVSFIVPRGCCDDCECGSFESMSFNWARSIRDFIDCGDAPVELECNALESGQPYTFAGKFSCAGRSRECSNVNVGWEITDMDGNLIASGSVTATPAFSFNIPSVLTPGTYQIKLTGYCGTQQCECVVFYTVPSCLRPQCSCGNFETDVNLGFSVETSLAGCKTCFEPKGLRECDRVSWYVGSLAATPIHTIGKEKFCFNPIASGNYVIFMVVNRMLPNGVGCFVKMYTEVVNIQCLSLPGCNDPVIINPTIGDGAQVGVLGSGGNARGWNRLAGAPEVIQNDGCGEDGWAMKLSGNLDASDAIGQSGIPIDQDQIYTLSFCAKPADTLTSIQGGKIYAILASGEVPSGDCLISREDCIVIGEYDMSDVNGWVSIQDTIRMDSVAFIRPSGVYTFILTTGNGLTNRQGDAPEDTYSTFVMDNICLQELEGNFRNCPFHSWIKPEPGSNEVCCFSVDIWNKGGYNVSYIEITGINNANVASVTLAPNLVGWNVINNGNSIEIYPASGVISNTMVLEDVITFCLDNYRSYPYPQVTYQIVWWVDSPQSPGQLVPLSACGDHRVECILDDCGTFGDLTIQENDGVKVNTICNRSYSLECPATTVLVEGTFDCSGNTMSNIEWEIIYLEGGANTIIRNGTVLASPKFNISLTSSDFSQSGRYGLYIKGLCNYLECPCLIEFFIRDCDPVNVRGALIENSIILYPNPANQSITLEFKDWNPGENTMVQILDLSGKEASHQELAKGSSRQQVSLEQLPTGMYIVRILEDGLPVWHGRVVKQ